MPHHQKRLDAIIQLPRQRDIGIRLSQIEPLSITNVRVEREFERD